jgi:hypothetical protein
MLKDGKTGKEGKENQARAPPEILYHGTTAPYVFDMIKHFGQYQHIVDDIYMTDFISSACGYAETRTQDISGIENVKLRPVVLAVNTKQLKSPIKSEYGGNWIAEAINLEAMLLLHKDFFNNRLSKGNPLCYENDIKNIFDNYKPSDLKNMNEISSRLYFRSNFD